MTFSSINDLMRYAEVYYNEFSQTWYGYIKELDIAVECGTEDMCYELLKEALDNKLREIILFMALDKEEM